jgi:hypothetical protein
MGRRNTSYAQTLLSPAAAVAGLAKIGSIIPTPQAVAENPAQVTLVSPVPLAVNIANVPSVNVSNSAAESIACSRCR